jgi:hypothetical protein
VEESTSESLPQLQSDHLVSSDSDEDYVGLSTAAAPADLSKASVHPYETRLKHNIRQPKRRTDGTVTYSVSRVSPSEPTSHVLAMKHPLWRQAMHDEFDALIKNET